MKINNAKRYLSLYNQEDYLFNFIWPQIRNKWFLDFDEFYMIYMWKSARPKNKYLKNRTIIEKITKEAFLESDELMKMEKLCQLDGVGIPTASALLTIVFPDKYAVIDIRCIEMLQFLNVDIKKTITPKNRLKYLDIMRNRAKENELTPRELDKVFFAMHRERLEDTNYRNLY